MIKTASQTAVLLAGLRLMSICCSLRLVSGCRSGTASGECGRVLCAVGLGDTVGAAQAGAYALVDRISWDGMLCRRDIGHRAIARERTSR